MKLYYYIILIILSFQLPAFSFSTVPESFENLIINDQHSYTNFNEEDFHQYKHLSKDLSIRNNDINDSSSTEFFYIFHSFKDGTVTLNNKSHWSIGYWYKKVPTNWTPGDRIKLSLHFSYSNNMKLENIDKNNVAWGSFKNLSSDANLDKIARIPNYTEDPNRYKMVVLKNGLKFLSKTPYFTEHNGWHCSDRVFIFHQNDDLYSLLNLENQDLVKNLVLVGNEKNKKINLFEIEDILSLEDNINQRVLAQPKAVHAVTTSIINYVAGLKDKQTPIGAFLFIGPSGVGKTELAKATTDEIYKRRDFLIRFDMSHFALEHAAVRFIGSPPGYVNHEEGGQLTEALKEHPQSVVLLDEVEKAHPKVRKYFLPVFDEGYLTDSKNYSVDCSKVIFILTSNLFAQEITDLFNEGYRAKEVLEIVEPLLMEKLSPELYNRLEPVLFEPLKKETMESLVVLMLKRVEKRLKELKGFTFIADESVNTFLVEKGFHPTLGARPLEKLIEKTIINQIAKAIIQEEIPNGSTITLSYTSDDNTWHIDWFKPEF